MIRFTQLNHSFVLLSLLLGRLQARGGGASTFHMPANLQGAALGIAHYAESLVVGGVQPLAYSIESGSLPPGLILNRVAAGTSQLFLSAQLQIGGQRAEILYIGNAPGIVEGVFQLNGEIPLSAESGRQPVRLSVGGIQSPADVVLWVQ